MFSHSEIERAVELQRKSYVLLQWVAVAVKRGIVSFGAAHTYSSATSAAEESILRHYQNIPQDTRPAHADLKDFSGLFTTYLENSFDLAADPGQRRYSPDAHCFCPMCSCLVDIPNLTTKTPTPQDKKRARKMMRETIKGIATEHSISLSEKKVEDIVDDAGLREQLALCTYGRDLFPRMRGNAVGAAALVLWRTFAWLPTGSPKKKFVLTADLILKAEKEMCERVLSEANH